MKKKLLVLCLTLALCPGLTLPAAAEQKIVVNGHPLTGEKDYAVFEVQSGYALTITNLSAATFSPGNACTQTQIVTFLYRAFA